MVFTGTESYRPFWQPEPDKYRIKSADGSLMDVMTKKDFEEYFEINQQIIEKELTKKKFDL